MNEHYPFRLKELPYEYNALEPFIDEATMRVHHDGHLATYVKNLNDILKNYPKYQELDLISLLKNSRYFPMELQRGIINNAGGVFNHNLYFSLLKKSDINNMPERLKNAIIKDFGTIDNFIKMLKKYALDVFGSGYTFLVVDRFNKLKLINTANQETPILSSGLFPILLIDVWEHAYYLKHKNKRIDYIEDFIKVINWDKVNEFYINFVDN